MPPAVFVDRKKAFDSLTELITHCRSEDCYPVILIDDLDQLLSLANFDREFVFLLNQLAGSGAQFVVTAHSIDRVIEVFEEKGGSENDGYQFMKLLTQRHICLSASRARSK